MDPNRQRQIELEAEAEAQAQFEFEQEQAQRANSEQNSGLGANFNDSFGSNVVRGGLQYPASVAQIARDVTVDLPKTLKNATAEGTAHTIGDLAAGTAGAAFFAPAWAGYGFTAGGPVGAVAGGLAGGAAGFAGGMLGFDVAGDVIPDAINAGTGTENAPTYTQPADHYLKSLGYNLGQGLVGGAIMHGAFGVPEVPGEGPGPGQQGPRQAPKFEGVTGLVPYAWDTVRGPWKDQSGKVADRLTELNPNISPELQTALDAQAIESQTNPLVLNQTTGELLNNRELKSATTAMESAGTGPLARIQDARAARGDSQLRALDGIDPSTQTAADAQSAISTDLQAKNAAQEAAIIAAQGKVGDAVNDLPAPTSPDAVGYDIRQPLKVGDRAARDAVSAFFQGAGNPTIDPAAARIAGLEAKKIYFQKFGAQPDTAVEGLLKQLTESPDGAPSGAAEGAASPRFFSLREIQALRSQALDVAGYGGRDAGVANAIADGLLQSGQDAIAQGMATPEEIGNWNKGIAARNAVGALFESGANPNKGVLRNNFGNFEMPDSTVPSRYFRPGTSADSRGIPEGFKALWRGTRNDPAVLEQIQRYATDIFRDAAVNKDNTVDTKAANAFLSRYSAALDQMPELKQQLTDIHGRQQFVNDLYGNAKRSQAEVDQGRLRAFLQADPDKAIGTLFTGPDMSKDLMRLTQKVQKEVPGALPGLRRGVIDYFKNKAFIPDKQGVDEALISGQQFTGTVRTGVFSQELNKALPALRASGLFTKDQLAGFDRLYGDARSQMSLQSAKPLAQSPTASNLSTLGAILDGVSSKFLKPFANAPGLKQGLDFLKTLTQAKFKNALTDALLDPKIARDMMNKANAQNVMRGIESVFGPEITQSLTGAPMLDDQRKSAPKPNVPPPPRPVLPPSVNKIVAAKTTPRPEEIQSPKAPGTFKRTAVDNAQISIESGDRKHPNGNPDAVSPKGAQGLMQIMPATGKWIGEQLHEPYTPIVPGMTQAQRDLAIDQNLRFGKWYRDDYLLPKYGGDKRLAAAAYNAGPGAVDRYGGVPPYAETQDYVKNLVGKWST